MIMVIYRIISLVFGIVSIFLGTYVFYKNNKNKINIIFFINCIILGIFLLINVNTWSLKDKGIVEIYYILMVILLVFNESLMFHFYIEFTELKVKFYIIILIYLPAVILSVSTFFTKTIFSDFIWHDNFWYALPAYNSIWSVFYILCYYIIFFITKCILLLKWTKKNDSKKNRIQVKIIVSSFILIYLTSFISDYIFRLFNIFMPPIGPLFYSFYISSLFYCLIKYRFLIFNISDIAMEIVSHIDDFIIIMNREGRLIFTNISFETRIPSKKNFLFKDIIIENESLTINLKDLFEGKVSQFKEKIIFQNDNENIYSDSYFSRIIDKPGDFIGILVISKELLEIRKFIKMYKITRRQLEIINLSIDGLSNNEISEKLNLTKRTVETHLGNIYAKLSINNKIELMKISNKFNLNR